MTRSKGEKGSGMEEGAEERRVIGGGFLPSAFGGGAFGAAAREVKDDFFFLLIFLVGILREVDRAPFISFLCRRLQGAQCARGTMLCPGHNI